MKITSKKYLLCFFMVAFILFTANAQTNNHTEISDLEFELHNNKTIKLTELKDKVVLLDFWYRGCFPCLKAIPDLIQLQEEFKDNLVIIGINDRDIKEDVIDYFDYKKVNYLSTYKTQNNISKNLKIKEFPTTILYDKKGNIIRVDTGYSKKGIQKLRKAIRTALK